MPEALPWLDGNPMIYISTREGVIFSVVFWLSVLVILYFFLYLWRTREAQPAAE
jgi:hypothetical protein